MKMTMQDGLRIIFGTQLSHKTDRGQMAGARGQEFLNQGSGMGKLENDIKNRA